MEAWQPTENDLKRTAELLSHIEDGGMWVIPGTLSAIVIHHTISAYEWIMRNDHYNNDRVDIVLRKLGWKVANTG